MTEYTHQTDVDRGKTAGCRMDKGDCSYFSIPHGGNHSANAVWSYEAPYAAVTLIKGHLAFYPDRVDAIEERHGE